MQTATLAESTADALDHVFESHPDVAPVPADATVDAVNGSPENDRESQGDDLDTERYLRWLYPYSDALVNVACKPPAGATDEYGEPVSFKGTICDGIDHALEVVRHVANKGAVAVWTTVHKGKATACGTAKEKWYADDVERYQFLWLDLDNKPAVTGRVCATDREREQVRERAEKIRNDLAAFGRDYNLPSPAMIDSGNGVYLAYPIDLPNTPDNRDLIRRLAAALGDVYNATFCELDVDVAQNPAVIVGVPGTVNAGRSEVPDQGRLARRRRIIDLPDREPMSGPEFIAFATAYLRDHAALTDAAANEPGPPATPPARRPDPVSNIPVGVDADRATVRLRDVALKYLAKCEPAVEGQGGDLATFRKAGHLLAFRYKSPDGPSLSADDVANIMLHSPWNARCSPPWDAKELVAKVRSAAGNGTPRLPTIVDDDEWDARQYLPLVRSRPQVAPPADAPVGPVLRALSTYTKRAVQWVWRGRIPIGKLTMIVGDGGSSKSTLTFDIAARVTTGQPWPDVMDGTPRVPGDVIVISGEDDPADGIAPRIAAAGGDLSRVKTLDIRERGKDGRVYERPFTLADLPALEQALSETPGCRLIVIDPIGAMLGKIDSHKSADVQTVLAPLHKLAARHDVGVVLVHHMNKGTGSASSRVMGTAAFRNTVRVLHFVLRDPAAPESDRRLFLTNKINCGKQLAGLAYSIVDHRDEDIDDTVPKLVWESGTVDMSADDALHEGATDDRTKLSAAKEWLVGHLVQPTPAAEIMDAAHAADISVKTLHRAADELKVAKGPQGFKGPWVWSLPKPRAAPVPIATTDTSDWV